MLLKNFRLLAIIACIIAVLLLQLRSSYLIEFWRQAFQDRWKHNLLHTERLIGGLIRDKLYEPFSPVHKKVKSFIGADTDVIGFKHWLRTKAIKDSLVGAGFVWQRDVDSLIVIPLTTDVDSVVQRNIYHYLSTENDPELVGPPVPTRISFYSDSLKTEINNKVGFAIYQYRFYDEYKTRRQRAEATQAVLGIIWNHENS